MNARSVVAPAASTVLLLAGCGLTDPDDLELTVEISAAVSNPYIGVAEDGGQQIECEVMLEAKATGPMDAVAIWDGGVLRWYWGTNRTDPGQIDALTSSEVAGIWEHEQLRSGQTATAGLNTWATVPFLLETEFRYVSGRAGSQRAAIAQFGCGLDLDIATPPRPVVSAVTIQAPAPFEPGNSFTVSYVASADGGLWHTSVIIDGAYHTVETIAERLTRETVRTVELTVPPGITLGVPIDVSVEAVDAFGQISTPVSTRSAPLVDVTPPSLMRVTTSFGLEPGVDAWLVGQYGVGDTLQLFVITSDNQELGELILDVGSDRSIIALEGSYRQETVKIDVPSHWIGAPGMSIQVTDAQGLLGPRHVAHPDSIRVFPVATRPTASWSAPSTFNGAAWDDVRDRLYVMAEDEAKLFVISTATMSLDRLIPLPSQAGGVDFTPSGDSLVVTLPDRGIVAVIDLVTDDMTEIALADAGLTQPGPVLVITNSRALVAARDAGGEIRLALIDLADGTVISTNLLPGHSAWRIRMARSADRSVVGALGNEGCLIVYDVMTDRFSSCFTTGSPTGPLSADATGSRFLVAGQIIDVASRTRRTPDWGVSPYGVNVSAFSADDESLYLSHVKGLTRVRISDGVALERVTHPMIYGLVLPSPDGNRLLTISNYKDTDPYQIRVDRVTLR